MLKHVAIVGVGLIGTSFALAAKRDLTPESAPRIIGVDLDVQYVEQARQRGAIDAAGTFEQAASADLVLLAVPVRQMPQVLAALKPHLAVGTGFHSLLPAIRSPVVSVTARWRQIRHFLTARMLYCADRKKTPTRWLKPRVLPGRRLVQTSSR